MKTLALAVIIFVALLPDAFAQTKADTSLSYFNIVERIPRFPGGNDSMMRFISSHLTLPDSLKETKTIVWVQVIVEPDSTLSHVTILKSVNPTLDNEALRVVALMPKWIPGMQAGKKVRVMYRIPVRMDFQ
jgi:protein TonB